LLSPVGADYTNLGTMLTTCLELALTSRQAANMLLAGAYFTNHFILQAASK
jgi:hypothetical protein